MSYYVSYNPEQASRYPTREKVKAVKAGRFITGVLILGLLICCLSIQEIRNFLIPGDPEVTIKATAKLLEEIKDGEGFVNAFTAFCEMVVTNGSK